MTWSKKFAASSSRSCNFSCATAFVCTVPKKDAPERPLVQLKSRVRRARFLNRAYSLEMIDWTQTVRTRLHPRVNLLRDWQTTVCSIPDSRQYGHRLGTRSYVYIWDLQQSGNVQATWYLLGQRCIPVRGSALVQSIHGFAGMFSRGWQRGWHFELDGHRRGLPKINLIFKKVSMKGVPSLISERPGVRGTTVNSDAWWNISSLHPN